MPFFAQILLETLSAALLALAIPNEFLKYGSALLGIAALVPHYIALETCPSLRRTAALCFFQSCLTHLLSSFWLAFFKDFAVFTLGASALGTGGIHALFALFFYLPKFSRTRTLFKSSGVRFFESSHFKIVWFSCVYTLYEFVKSTGFLAYPWGTLPMTAYRLKILPQITDITGVRGLTALFSAAGALAAVLVLDSVQFSVKKAFSRNKNAVFAVFSLFALSSAYGIFQYNKPRTPVKYMNTVFVQQNYDPWEIREDGVAITESQNLTMQGIAEFKAKNLRPDLVVWSEGILNYPFPQGMLHYKFYPESNPLLPFIAHTDVPTVIGAPVADGKSETGFYNAAVLFDKDANMQGFHAKTHLVPFAEEIPFTEYEFVQKMLKTAAGFSSGWSRGTQFSSFPVPLHGADGKTALVSLPVCFEDAFGDVCSRMKKNGAEVFVNITDDSWSLTRSAEYQHFAAAKFRAIELRTTFTRATNSGYTAVVDPAGNIKADLPLFEKTYLAYEVPVYENTATAYLLFGEWLSFLAAVFALSVLAAVILLQNRR